MDIRTNLHSGQLGLADTLTLLRIAKGVDPQTLAALQQGVGQLTPGQITDLMGVICKIDPTEVPGLLNMAGGG